MVFASLQISNYKGINHIQTIDFAEETLLIGKNNSGKTTIAEFLDFLRSSLGERTWISGTNTGNGERVLDMKGMAAGNVTRDLFFDESKDIEFSVKFTFIPTEYDNFDWASFFHKFCSGVVHETIECNFTGQMRVGEIKLVSLDVCSVPIFREDDRTLFFDAVDGWEHHYQVKEQSIEQLLFLPAFFLKKTIYMPSKRIIDGSDTDADIYQIAKSQGVISWFLRASTANLEDSAQENRRKVKRKIISDFSSFLDQSISDVFVNQEKQALNIEYEDGTAIPLKNCGTGIAESLFIILIANLAEYEESGVLIIEEPELHLHPTFQQKLLNTLRVHNRQIMYTTHSASVLNNVMENDGRVYRTSLDDNKNVDVRVMKNNDTRRIVADLGYSPAEFMMADKVIWVEGPHDIAPIAEFVNKCLVVIGLQKQVAVMHLGGGNDIYSSSMDWNQIKEINSDTFVLLDKETNPQTQEERKIVKKRINSINIDCHITDRAAIENYFPLQILKQIYPKLVFPSQLNNDEYLIKQIGNLPRSHKKNNGKIARLMNWSDISKTDLGKAIEDFIRK